MTTTVNLILKCSECSELAPHEEPASWNTFGAIFWTDGKVEGPGMAEENSVRKCPYCGAVVWVEDLETIGHVPFHLLPSDKTSLPFFSRLRTQDYHRALLKPPTDLERHTELRLLAWQSGNDPRRCSKARERPLADAEQENLVRLLHLVRDKAKVNDHMLKAEVSRELGDFRAAKAHLHGALSGPESGITWVARFIGSRIEMKDPYVRAVPRSR